MSKEKIKKDKAERVPLSAFEKAVIVISVLLVILTALCGAAKWGVDQIRISGISDLSGEGIEIDEKALKIADFILPKEVELQSSDGEKFNVGLAINHEFDPDATKSILDYLNILNVYDWDGNLIENEDKIQKFDLKGNQLKLMALLKLAEMLTKVKNIINNTLVVLILLDIAAAVFIAYIIWKRADDKREAQEKALSEMNVKKVTGVSEEEARRPKNAKKKKKNKK